MKDWTASTQVKVKVREDGHAEICVPWMDVPLVLAPSEQVMFTIGTALTAASYVEGAGWH